MDQLSPTSRQDADAHEDQKMIYHVKLYGILLGAWTRCSEAQDYILKQLTPKERETAEVCWEVLA